MKDKKIRAKDRTEGGANEKLKNRIPHNRNIERKSQQRKKIT